MSVSYVLKVRDAVKIVTIGIKLQGVVYMT